MSRTIIAAVLLLAAGPAFAQTRATTVPNPMQSRGASAAAPASTATSPATSSPSSANQFTTQSAAQGHCSGDTVVWVNTRSKAYHFQGTRYYGHTKVGAYMCQKDADTDGMHATQGEKTAAAATKH